MSRAVPNVATIIAATSAPLASPHSGARAGSDTRWRRYPPTAAPMRAGTMKAAYVLANADGSGDAAIPSATMALPTVAIRRLMERLASMFAFHHVSSIVPSPSGTDGSPTSCARDARPSSLHPHGTIRARR